MDNIMKFRRGLTLIELIISLAIIGIIIVSFLPIFTMSVKTNNKSQNTLDSTYLGKDAMELIYHLSNSINFEDLEDELTNSENGFIKKSETPTEITFEYKYPDNKYLSIKFVDEENLIRVISKVYIDKSEEKIEAQYEKLYSWIGRGFLK